MHLLALSASTSDPSNSGVLLDAFIEGMRQVENVEVTKLKIKELAIEHFELKFYDSATPQGADFERVRSLMERSAGIAIGSPIWNFGFPAQLKNLIDRMGAFGLDSETRSRGMLQGKPFYLILTGGAPEAAWLGLMRRTTSHLHEAIRYFGGTVIRRHFEPKCMVGEGQFGLCVDKRPRSLANMRREGKRFATIAKAYAETGKLPLRELILYHVYQLGQRIVRRLT